jgi:hypothetical protein
MDKPTFVLLVDAVFLTEREEVLCCLAGRGTRGAAVATAVRLGLGG